MAGWGQGKDGSGLPYLTVVQHGRTRRQILAAAGGGFGGLALRSLGMPSNPWSARPGVRPARAKSVIFLFMVGGPSQIDTFDYKPLLAKLDGQKVPDSFRKAVDATRFRNVFHGCKEEIMASPWQFRQHGQSGLWVSELFPETARHADRLCVIHSMQADSNNHGPASIQLHTGDINGGKASLGSWVTYALGSENRNLPAYVLLFQAGPLGGATNYSNGFLPPAYQGTRLRDDGVPVADLLPPGEFAEGHGDALRAVAELNALHGRNRPLDDELAARTASYELAGRMQLAAMEVGNLDNEPAALRAAYGIDDKDEAKAGFGRKCLLARRLVERGVRFVQVYDMADKDGWDGHSQLRKNHERHAGAVDRGVAALLDDLSQRGLLDETLVIWASEFGRTPMMQGDAGRQHNCAGFTIWMAGGGVQPGLRYGATDEIGLMAIDRPVPFRDLHATILEALGLDHEALAWEVNGRLERLTGVQNMAQVIPGILT
ncbi:MAG: hypothetical protein RLZZ179_3001 [Verrucomicrobiota bacterium]